MTAGDVRLHFEDVHVRFPGSRNEALAGCSFSLRKGEHAALIGINGSGKTTVLMAAAGLVPFTGVITVNGVRLDRSTLTRVRQQIGFLFSAPEDQLLFPRVVDDVAFSLIHRGVDAPEALARARDILKEFDAAEIAEDTPGDLSHGQRLRVALAGVLITRPPLLLLDEPSSALDPPAKHHLAARLNSSEATVLLATHDLQFAGSCCRRFLMLERGHLVVDTANKADLHARLGPMW